MYNERKIKGEETVRVMNNLFTIATSDEGKQLGKELWNVFTDALSGDYKPWIELINIINRTPMSAKTLLFYSNFQHFLDGMKSDTELQRKFQEFLNHEEKRNENSKRIIQLIDEMDSDIKVNALIALTKSVSYGFITKRDYYRMGKIIENIIAEDLEYLENNICREEIEEMELTEEFVRNGLMYITDSGSYAYSRMAFYLDKFGLSYGDKKYKYNGESDFVPNVFPKKQEVITEATDEDINKIFEEFQR